MKPEIFGVWSYFLLWGVAAFTGLTLGVRVLLREGMSLPRAGLFVLGVAVVLVSAAKGASALEFALWPRDRPGLPAGSVFGSWIRGYQSPSGAVLMLLALLPLARVLGASPLRIADVFFPVFGLATVFMRIGCFLNGCCSGTVCHLPWALSFPQFSPTHRWQMAEGLVGAGSGSLPVHPLQLYYVLLGLAVFGLGQLWLRRRAYEGQVWLRCSLLFFGATFCLELLKVPRVHVNLILAAVVTLGLAAILIHMESRAVRASGA